MKLNGLCISVFSAFFVALIAWYLTQEETSCTVNGAGRENINGYYAAFGGIYLKQGYNIFYNPDIFKLLDIKRTVGVTTIAFSKHLWSINDHIARDVVYVNTPEHPEQYLYRPPKLNWKPTKEKDLPPPSVIHCTGSLETSVPINAHEASNIDQLMDRPVTTLLLGAIFGIAYYLWAYKIEVSAVAYSYEAVVTRAEYWRVVTASFAHFDLLHLGFNTMSLYQLGMLESVYGSATFLFLNLSLVIVTMVICTAIYHVMITRYGRTDMYSQPAVGYSCVLFAWMVALSVRLEQYCPIFLLPKLCVKTWLVPLPSMLSSYIGSAIPVNIGPFVLLLFTRLIMPRSSLIGHLSGIIIGYPLAWNMLNWLTTPVLVALILAVYVYTEHLYVWQYPSFTATMADLEVVLSASLFRNYKMLHIVAYFLILSVPVSVYFMGLIQLPARVVMAYMCYSTVHACRIEWCASTAAVKEQCSWIMLLAVLYVTMMFMYDLSTVVATVNSTDLLEGCGLYVGFVRFHMYHLVFVLMLQACFIAFTMINLIEARSAVGVLTKFRCDAQSIVDDMRVLTCTSENDGVHARTGGVAPFSGTGHRLSGSSGSSNNIGVVHV